ncbi:OLC1v1026996C1 [Oldenlandia corymbosa var. corymbosa]|uniref:OLC1v1026996C1 n=1 Tax=Oldenlandia corymbosa var. corymbosa TaxID=529605 RepID=A0AAV1CBF7_OLDCO|nr:OLC1v1026996C1 [Oldenlandia corymbosa var. corymbosa]
MEKELVELFERVKKAADAAAVEVEADSSAAEDRCVDALKRLKGLPINYDVLVSTQVGKRLRQLTKHPRKRIQSLASDVVEIWKGIIVKETTKNKKNGAIENQGSFKRERAGGDSGEEKKVQRVNSIKVEDSVKCEPVRAEYDDKKKIQKVSSVKVERNEHSYLSNSEKMVKVETSSSTQIKVENGATVKAEKSYSSGHVKVESIKKEDKLYSDSKKPAAVPVGPPKLTSLPYTKDKNRDKIRELLAEALGKVAGEVYDDLRESVDACDPLRVATEVESALFAKWGLFNGAQKVRYRSIMFNIKDPNNPDFRRKVLLGQFPPKAITDLSPEDMASDERQKQNEKIKEKALFECERGAPVQASTDQFQCTRCKKKETTYYQMQTRSADEPMTTYVTCVNCGNRWKFC